MEERKKVNSDEWLYRRSYCSPEKKYCNPDGTATSRAFKLRESDNNELSVDVKSLSGPEISIKDSTKYFLFEIANKSVEDIGLETFHDPDETGGNTAHAVILGMTMEDEVSPVLLAKKSKRVILNEVPGN